MGFDARALAFAAAVALHNAEEALRSRPAARESNPSTRERFQGVGHQNLQLCNSQAWVSPKSHDWIEKVFAWSIF
jgi:hypothetical protein